MGNEKSPQFLSRNGHKYIYSKADKCWYEFYKTENLPLDVIEQVKEIQEKAEELIGSLGIQHGTTP